MSNTIHWDVFLQTYIAPILLHLFQYCIVLRQEYDEKDARFRFFDKSYANLATYYLWNSHYEIMTNFRHWTFDSVRLGWTFNLIVSNSQTLLDDNFFKSFYQSHLMMTLLCTLNNHLEIFIDSLLKNQNVICGNNHYSVKLNCLFSELMDSYVNRDQYHEDLSLLDSIIRNVRNTQHSWYIYWKNDASKVRDSEEYEFKDWHWIGMTYEEILTIFKSSTETVKRIISAFNSHYWVSESDLIEDTSMTDQFILWDHHNTIEPLNL